MSLRASQFEFLDPEGFIPLLPPKAAHFRPDRKDTIQIDAKAHQNVLADFQEKSAQKGFSGLLLDYGHAGEEAAGWIVEMIAKEAGLFGRVAWTKAGLELVRSGVFRRISPVVSLLESVRKEDILPEFDYCTDERVRPTAILEATLCNVPFLTTMQPITRPVPARSVRSSVRRVVAGFKFPAFALFVDCTGDHRPWQKKKTACAGFIPAQAAPILKAG